MPIVSANENQVFNRLNAADAANDPFTSILFALGSFVCSASGAGGSGRRLRPRLGVELSLRLQPVLKGFSLGAART